MIDLRQSFVPPQVFAEQARGLSAQWDNWHGGDPHCSFAWLALLAETAMPPDVKMGLLDCGDGEGGAPCYLALLSDPKQPRLLCAAGNFYTPLFSLIGGGRPNEKRLRDLAGALRIAFPKVVEIRLSPLDLQQTDADMLRSAFQASGWWGGEYFCFGNWYQQVIPGGFDAYLAGRSSRLRNTLRRAEKKLRSQPVFDIQVFRGGEPDFEQAIADFVTVYGLSWKEPEPYPEFIPGLCRWAASQNGLLLGVVSIEGKPIAAQLWLLAGRCAYIVKLSYDKDYFELSPGTVLSARLFREAMDTDRVEVIDYLIGDDGYKSEWTGARRERWGIVLFRQNSFVGALGFFRQSLNKYVKRKNIRFIWPFRI